MTATKHFHLIVPVWGKTYTALFTDVCLPMLMTPGNLGAMGTRSGDQFIILTTWADWQAMQNAPSVERLERMIRIEWILVDLLVDISQSHRAMSECFAIAMRRKEVVPGQTCFIFLTPDSFWSEGTFRRMSELANQDIKVVMACGLRVNSEAMSTVLLRRIQQSPENPAMPQADLVRIALTNLHQLSAALNILSPAGFLNAWPSHLYWINERDRQFIAHCFHLHPLLVVAPVSAARIGTTVDGDFLNNLRYPLNSYHVLQEEYVAIELSPAARTWGQPLGVPKLGAVVRFALLHANSRHWHFFRKRIVLGVTAENPIDPLLDQSVENVVQKILKKRALANFIQILGIHHILRRVLPRAGKAKRRLKRLMGRV